MNFQDLWGLELTVKGSDEFIEQVNEDLDKIREGAKGAELLKNLEDSNNEHIIVETSGGNGCEPNPKGGYTEGTGSGSTVYYNPEKKTGGKDSTGSTERPPFVGLAHELGHSEAFDNGTQNFDRGTKEPDTTPPSEENSLKRENDVRKENNLKPRNFYY